jgi:V8-like Glu-specific endopeptidase
LSSTKTYNKFNFVFKASLLIIIFFFITNSNHAQGFKITNPQKDVVLYSGSFTTIQWNDSISKNARLEFSTDSAKSWVTICQSSNFSCPWQVPSQPSEFCFFRLTDLVDSSFKNSYFSAFKIRKPFIAIQSPVSDLIKCAYNSLTWKFGGLNNINSNNFTISYKEGNSNQWRSMASQQAFFPADSAKVSMYIPATDSLKGFLKISFDGDPAQFVVKQFNLVSHSPDTITFLYPNGGEKLFGGEILKLKWQNTGTIDKIDLQYANYATPFAENMDDVSNSGIIADGIANTGSYDWKLPNVSTGFSITISEHNKGCPITYTAKTFTISSLDTIISYDAKTKTETTILPIKYDGSTIADNTDFSIGDLGNKTNLILIPPTKNLYPGSHYTKPDNATSYYDIRAFPIRTAVKLYSINDGYFSNCSGTLVNEKFVLTSAHCIKGYQRPSYNWSSGTLIAPAFNNGAFQEGFDSSQVKKYYIFKGFSDTGLGDSDGDFALLELEKPLGKKLGWVSMAFNKDTNFFKGKVFHKFSYPGRSVDRLAEYNADTLFYNYGMIDALRPPYLGSYGAIGHPGQSGSEILYTDNNTIYNIYGLAQYSYYSNNLRLPASAFYAFKEIIKNSLLGIDDNKTPNQTVELYPNPASDYVHLKLEVSRKYSLALYTPSGSKVTEESFYGEEKIISLAMISPGMYVLEVKSEGNTPLKSKIIIAR